MSILDTVRPAVRALDAYLPGSRDGNALWLNNNESGWPTAGVEPSQHRYPAAPRELQQRLATVLGLERAGLGSDALLATRGSDDAIDAILRCFCEAGNSEVIVTPPTFGMYEVFATVQGAAVVNAPLEDDFEFPLEAVLAACTERTRVIFACTPNNPTGNTVPLDIIEQLCARRRDQSLVVVDEAYIEFADGPSAIELLQRFDNLVVLRTLSKARALAGARCGVAIARPEVIAMIRKVLPPYLLPAPSVDVILAALAPAALAESEQRIEIVRQQRLRLEPLLEDLEMVRRVWPSAGNYFLVEVDDAQALDKQLRRQGIIVRRFDPARQPRLANCLRITISSPADNERLLQAMKSREVA
ncbi:MAG: histidinol-phosphate transaminase [Gammaproteobacteria bacterium]|nr:histidinol-phosphate transaminase [Gammaproteobacteria bacterium]